MTKELAVKNLTNAVSGINPEQVEILRKTLFKGFSDDEIQFSLAVCNRTGLDPFVRQVHFNKRKNRKTNEETIVITTGIDGFRLTAARSGAYAGSDEPKYRIENGKLLEASVTVFKLVQAIRCPFTATARWNEFYPGDGNDGFMWRKMPFVMLAKCAEAQALRKAFPFELSNVYSHEEMAQASNTKEVVSTKAAEVNQLLEETKPSEIVVEPATAPDFVTEAAASAHPDFGDYVIPIGKKYKGKKLSEVPPEMLRDFATWVDENVENKTDETNEFLVNVSSYLESLKGN